MCGDLSMNAEKMEKITEFARMLGFRVMTDGLEWINFNVEFAKYSVKVKYDYTKRFFKENIIY
jgi:hypothetical protein